MANIGPMQWVIILIIIILLFGAKKIPELAKGVGKGIKTFKAEMDEPLEKVEKKDDESEAQIKKTENKEA
ncbi:MAG: twin-arginine translocase TatA/TatE family subunit [Campylobacter sp.]|nr:twin-arginine translocase TatA/TatE family subunit [Campylobacter sp.]